MTTNEHRSIKEGLWYFAHPYTFRGPDGRYSLPAEEANFRICCLRAARLIEAGWVIYAPICHTHPIHLAYPPFVGEEVHEMWYEQDNALIERANFTGIILAVGWSDSRGCREEKALFEQRGGQILYLLDPDTVSRSDPYNATRLMRS
jgi:hypothetical protein